MSKHLRGRFAPSPSGRMHLGNAFCALLAWLSARSKDGEMLLRIEDLDPQRCREEYTIQLKDDLQWLGLDWDIESQPQSARTERYARRLEQLGELVYPCYCSRGELHAASAPHQSDGAFIYSGACRGLTEQQRAQKQRLPAMRVIVPDEVVSFTDGHFGSYGENLLRDCGDFILRRSDGVYAYQLAVVTDDGEMGVTQVVRGRDLLESTPRQLYLYRLLGLEPPEFYHLPLLVAGDGHRLSKRQQDMDMGALRLRYSAPRLIGHLAHMAGLIDRPEPVTAAELVRSFKWDRVGRTDIIIDETSY